VYQGAEDREEQEEGSRRASDLTRAAEALAQEMG